MGNYSNSSKNIQRSQRVSKIDVGNLFEKKTSVYFHRLGIPVLVSARTLRKRNLGQIDLCIFSKKLNRIIVAECKCHHRPIGLGQRVRIRDSIQFICLVFGKQGEFKVLRPFAK